MTLPSLVGLTPRSESRIAFSISPIADLSYGVIRMMRASGVWKDASCCSGVGAP